MSAAFVGRLVMWVTNEEAAINFTKADMPMQCRAFVSIKNFYAANGNILKSSNEVKKKTLVAFEVKFLSTVCNVHCYHAVCAWTNKKPKSVTYGTDADIPKTLSVIALLHESGCASAHETLKLYIGFSGCVKCKTPKENSAPSQEKINLKTLNVHGVTGTVWRVINSKEGLLKFGNNYAWFNSSHLSGTILKNLKIHHLLGQVMHLDATCLWSSKTIQWYVVTVLWPWSTPRPSMDCKLIVPLELIISTAECTKQLQRVLQLLKKEPVNVAEVEAHFKGILQSQLFTTEQTPINIELPMGRIVEKFGKNPRPPVNMINNENAHALPSTSSVLDANMKNLPDNKNGAIPKITNGAKKKPISTPSSRSSSVGPSVSAGDESHINIKYGTATVWRVINRNEGLLNCTVNKQNIGVIWCHTSHLPVRLKNMTFPELIGGVFYYRAILIWMPNNVKEFVWYEASELREEKKKKKQPGKQNSVKLSEFESNSDFTRLLQAALRAATSVSNTSVIDRMFRDLTKTAVFTKSCEERMPLEHDLRRASASASNTASDDGIQTLTSLALTISDDISSRRTSKVPGKLKPEVSKQKDDFSQLSNLNVKSLALETSVPVTKKKKKKKKEENNCSQIVETTCLSPQPSTSSAREIFNPSTHGPQLISLALNIGDQMFSNFEFGFPAPRSEIESRSSELPAANAFKNEQGIKTISKGLCTKSEKSKQLTMTKSCMTKIDESSPLGDKKPINMDLNSVYYAKVWRAINMDEGLILWFAKKSGKIRTCVVWFNKTHLSSCVENKMAIPDLIGRGFRFSVSLIWEPENWNEYSWYEANELWNEGKARPDCVSNDIVRLDKFKSNSEFTLHLQWVYEARSKGFESFEVDYMCLHLTLANVFLETSDEIESLSQRFHHKSESSRQKPGERIDSSNEGRNELLMVETGSQISGSEVKLGKAETKKLSSRRKRFYSDKCFDKKYGHFLHLSKVVFLTDKTTSTHTPKAGLKIEVVCVQPYRENLPCMNDKLDVEPQAKANSEVNGVELSTFEGSSIEARTKLVEVEKVTTTSHEKETAEEAERKDNLELVLGNEVQTIFETGENNIRGHTTTKIDVLEKNICTNNIVSHSFGLEDSKKEDETVLGNDVHSPKVETQTTFADQPVDICPNVEEKSNTELLDFMVDDLKSAMLKNTSHHEIIKQSKENEEPHSFERKDTANRQRENVCQEMANFTSATTNDGPHGDMAEYCKELVLMAKETRFVLKNFQMQLPRNVVSGKTMEIDEFLDRNRIEGMKDQPGESECKKNDKIKEEESSELLLSVSVADIKETRETMEQSEISVVGVASRVGKTLEEGEVVDVGSAVEKTSGESEVVDVSSNAVEKTSEQKEKSIVEVSSDLRKGFVIKSQGIITRYSSQCGFIECQVEEQQLTISFKKDLAMSSEPACLISVGTRVFFDAVVWRDKCHDLVQRESQVGRTCTGKVVKIKKPYAFVAQCEEKVLVEAFVFEPVEGEGTLSYEDQIQFHISLGDTVQCIVEKASMNSLSPCPWNAVRCWKLEEHTAPIDPRNDESSLVSSTDEEEPPPNDVEVSKIMKKVCSKRKLKSMMKNATRGSDFNLLDTLNRSFALYMPEVVLDPRIVDYVKQEIVTMHSKDKVNLYFEKLFASDAQQSILDKKNDTHDNKGTQTLSTGQVLYLQVSPEE